MRHGALKHIAKDFEVRGLEVFQVVQQMWFILVGETTGQVLDTVSTGVESTSGHLFLSLTSLFRPPLSTCDVWLIFHSISTLYLCGGRLFLSLTSLFRPPLSICDVWLIFHSISTLYLCGGRLFLSLTSFFRPPLSICDVWSIEDNFCLAVDDGACVKAFCPSPRLASVSVFQP